MGITTSSAVSQVKTTMQVKGRFLYSQCGDKIILRGPNKMTTWIDREGKSFAEIAKTGSNVVRIVAVSTDKPSDIKRWIEKCIELKMIPMVENHTATGKWDEVPAVVAWWTSDSMVNVIKRYDDVFILNIANECGDGNVTDEQLREGYSDFIVKIRAKGINCPVVIDGMQWAQKPNQMLRVAPYILESDPMKNVIFSSHFYGRNEESQVLPVAGQEAFIKETVDSYIAKDLCFIWGEFGAGVPSDGRPVAYKYLLDYSATNEVGCLPWSFDNCNNDGAFLNMTSDNTFAGTEGWGTEVLLSLPNSFKNTARTPLYIANGRSIKTK